jgi:hypothetical protein
MQGMHDRDKYNAILPNKLSKDVISVFIHYLICNTFCHVAAAFTNNKKSLPTCVNNIM